jgi:hypothetical protein
MLVEALPGGGAKQKLAAKNPVASDAGRWYANALCDRTVLYSCLHARLDEIMEGLAWCRLFQALTWVGWSLRWEPPPQCARNSLEETVALADTLTR